MKIDKWQVGKRIRFIRKNKLGLSMEEFGKRIDEKVQSGTVANWETGKNLPNNQRLVKIAELGDMSVDELLGKGCIHCTGQYEPLFMVSEFRFVGIENNQLYMAFISGNKIKQTDINYCPMCGRGLKNEEQP